MEQIVVSSKVYITVPSDLLKSWIKRNFKIDNPEYAKKKKLGLGTWYTPKVIALYSIENGSVWSLPIGYLDKLKEGLEELNLKYEIVDRRQEGEDVRALRWNPTIKLRPYQQGIVKATDLNDNGVMVAPAGAGKSIGMMAVMMAHRKKTLILVHRKELLFQLQATARKVLYTEPCMIGGGGRLKMDEEADLYIATVQTLKGRPLLMDWLNKHIGLVMVDEAHNVPSTMFTEVLKNFQTKRKYGVTATPDRKDGMNHLLQGFLGDIIIRIDRSELVDGGKLITPELIPVYTDFNGTSAMHTVGESTNLGEERGYMGVMEDLIADDKRADLVVNTFYTNSVRQAKTLIIADRINYLEKLQDMILNHCGVTVPILVGKTPTTARKEILEKFNSGEYQYLLATGSLVREGLDIPSLEHLYLTMPMVGDRKGSDGASVEQAVGRIMRPDPANQGKEPKVFDFVDYHNEMLKRQWGTRRKVYKRLMMNIPKKRRVSMTEELNDILF